jgi:hypothetical protein
MKKTTAAQTKTMIGTAVIQYTNKAVTVMALEVDTCCKGGLYNITECLVLFKFDTCLDT